jgi:uncharacterized protein YbjT (DUF2867 family)
MENILITGATGNVGTAILAHFIPNKDQKIFIATREKNRIYLPAGKGKFLWVDIADIGLAIAKVLQNPGNHTNKAYTITGKELMDFHEVASLLSRHLNRQIKFVSPNLLQFFITKKREGMAAPFIFVMIMLHYLPKFQKPPEVSDDFTQLTSQQPRTLEKFIKDNLGVWE